MLIRKLMRFCSDSVMLFDAHHSIKIVAVSGEATVISTAFCLPKLKKIDSLPKLRICSLVFVRYF